MNRLGRLMLGLLLAASYGVTAAAQEAPAPKVLQIIREYTKPGKAGMAHERSESAYVQAMTRAKWPTNYLAMTSLSGPQRALFFTRYASLEAWEKDSAAAAKNVAFSAALERAAAADGELLASSDEGVFIFQPDLSLRPNPDLSQMRYMEISSYHVRPGHTGEWNELVKMVKAAYEQAVPGAHWGVYQGIYGTEAGTYLVFTGRKSLAEVDTALNDDDPKFAAALGEDGMKKFEELIGSAVDSSRHELFAFNPHMSYVPDEWIKADSFWKPQTAAVAAKKTMTAEKAPKPKPEP